jgi:DnaJ-domain-containing protein 1
LGYGTVNKEENCARGTAIQIQNRNRAEKLTAMNEYRQARRKEKHLFRKKKRQLKDQALIEIERNYSVQDSRKFCKRLNDTRMPFEPAVTMCQTTNGHLLTYNDQVLLRWKEYFE